MVMLSSLCSKNSTSKKTEEFKDPLRHLDLLDLLDHLDHRDLLDQGLLDHLDHRDLLQFQGLPGRQTPLVSLLGLFHLFPFLVPAAWIELWCLQNYSSIVSRHLTVHLLILLAFDLLVPSARWFCLPELRAKLLSVSLSY